MIRTSGKKFCGLLFWLYYLLWTNVVVIKKLTSAGERFCNVRHCSFMQQTGRAQCEGAMKTKYEFVLFKRIGVL